jgi:hypothetical protein
VPSQANHFFTALSHCGRALPAEGVVKPPIVVVVVVCRAEDHGAEEDEDDKVWTDKV